MNSSQTTRTQVDKSVRQEIDRYLHRVRLYRSLGFTEVERMIYSHLLVSDGCVRIANLSYLTGYSRAAIRPTLEDMLVMGLTVRGPDGWGWSMTPLGTQVTQMINRDAHAIAEGLCGGWSEELVDVLMSLPTEGVLRPFRLDGLIT